MLRRLRRGLKGLIADRQGTSVVEFALYAPVAAVFLMGITDVTMAYAGQLRLEQAAYRAIEKASALPIQSDYEFLKADAAAAAGVPQSAVAVTHWLECDGTVQPSVSGECPAGEMTSLYVRVAITSAYEPMFVAGPLILGSDDTLALSAEASVRLQ